MHCLSSVKQSNSITLGSKKTVMNRRKASILVAKITAVVTLVVMASCSATQKAITSGDPQIIYRHALDLYEGENWNKAAALFEMIEPYMAGAPNEDSLLYFKARCRFKGYNYSEAVAEFDEFRRRFGRSPFLEDAEGMYTLSYYYMAPGPTRDQQTTQLALISVEEFLSRYPDSEQFDTFSSLRDELVERLHEKTFLNAMTYYKIGRYKSAIVAFKNAFKQYPDSKYREEISYYVVASAYELADNSVPSKKEDRYLQMLDSYFTFIAEFPESKHRKEVDTMEKKARKYLAEHTTAEKDENPEDIDTDVF